MGTVSTRPTKRMAVQGETEWSPLKINEPGILTIGSYALMVLNSPISLTSGFGARLWDGAVLRSTVDGGTDRWLGFVAETGAQVKRKYPDIVSGDFDSIRTETLEACRTNGCEIVLTPDQDYTDFEKGLKAVVSRVKSKIDSILVLCESSGRIDQTLSNLNTLRLGPELEGRPRLYLMSHESLTWHLTAGRHEIRIPQYLRDKSQWCAILPFEPRENRVTTIGLKWDLNLHTIKFGGLISSSNTYAGQEKITVETDSELLWSMGL